MQDEPGVPGPREDQAQTSGSITNGFFFTWCFEHEKNFPVFKVEESHTIQHKKYCIKTIFKVNGFAFLVKFIILFIQTSTDSSGADSRLSAGIFPELQDVNNYRVLGKKLPKEQHI